MKWSLDVKKKYNLTTNCIFFLESLLALANIKEEFSISVNEGEIKYFLNKERFSVLNIKLMHICLQRHEGIANPASKCNASLYIYM
jgi:hypothetical protein